MYEEATDSVFIDRKEDRDHDFDWRKECSGNADTYAVQDLPIWQGDKIFFKLLAEDAPFFHLELTYDGDVLVKAVLDGVSLAL